MRGARAQECHGTGVQVMMRPLGPGMMQQIQQPCSNCRQTGFAPPPQDLCASCSGKVRGVGRPSSDEILDAGVRILPACLHAVLPEAAVAGQSSARVSAGSGRLLLRLCVRASASPHAARVHRRWREQQPLGRPCAGARGAERYLP